MKTVLHVLMFTVVITIFLSGSVSALGLFSVQSDQVATNTYHFTEDPDFYQADRNIIDFYYDFGDGKGTSEHNPIYTYQVPGTYSPSLKAVWQTADGRKYTTITTTSITIPVLASSVLESPTPTNIPISLNPENSTGFPPVPTPTPGVTVIQLSPFGVISGITPLPTPTILVADLFFQSSPGMYSAAVAGHKPGDTYWGELPGNPGVYGWITVTGTGMMV